MGNIYYTGIGISAFLDENKLKDREQIEIYAKSFVERHGYVFNRKDLNYLRYLENAAKSYNKSWLFKIKLLCLYWNAMDWTLGLSGLRLKRYLFAFVRRLPHSRAIQWSL